MESSDLDLTSNAPLHAVDCWWRAANYLTVGQLYLQDNPLLQRPLIEDDLKRRPVGHWGTAPALNFIYAHLNRLIVKRHIHAIFVAGPGHGGAAMLANAWLDHTYSELFPRVPADERGMRALFRQFSFPGGVPSHAAPSTPGSIHEGGELGYSLVHAFGAALDNPGQVIACVVGDGEAETGTLAASWHLNKVLHPTEDGVVLPILNLNGYKIANPSVLARIPEEELLQLFRGYGYEPILVSGGFDGEDPMYVHDRMAQALEHAMELITAIRQYAGPGRRTTPHWPMIILRTPKGWTGPRFVDGLPVENSWRSHQLPLTEVRERPERLVELERWMRSYRPEELFDRKGFPTATIGSIRPVGAFRMSANPIANGGESEADLVLPGIARHAVEDGLAEPTRVLGRWLADVIRLNPSTFRIFGPDETTSNRLDAVWAVTDTQWTAEVLPTDQHLGGPGRVIELLSENLMQGLLEGYLLTGRHGLLNSYEAFIHVVDSMFNQHAKWLESAADVRWRRSVPSFTYLLSSHVWRQDHNGFSHQDPGFLDVVVNKGPGVVRVYLPPDANSLLVTAEHCFTTRDHINVIVAGKQPSPILLTLEEARTHGARGLGIWDWAGTEVPGLEPDVVMASAGDVPTLEALAAVRLLHEHIPALRIRFVNVVDLMRLLDPEHHEHGMPDADFDAVFGTDVPIVFAFHGYPSLVHQLAYRRHSHPTLHVRGFRERGTTTTPFDMLAMNDLDRYRLAMDVIRYVPGLERRHASLAQEFDEARSAHVAHAHEFGVDDAELSDWSWVRSPKPGDIALSSLEREAALN